MTTSWQSILISALVGLAGVPAIADQPSAPLSETSATCPPIAQDFLEAIGLLPELPDYARSLVVIDLEGRPLDCVPQTLPPPLHARAAAFLLQFSIVMARDQEAGPVCRFGEARLEDTSFIGLILSDDPAQIKSQACLQRARQDLEGLRDR
ncbi:hypothetical protein [Paracoccus marcusii]|uniref:hypothetical protein n=1 Tax=Paracoccus marcusii TaxID=59779 RepID=UPI00248FE9FA|nr:hypothetical protein [Paracoccus marcusii]